ncbi:MAG: heavy metal-associated domain-containing protein [Chitinophagales bacterium]
MKKAVSIGFLMVFLSFGKLFAQDNTGKQYVEIKTSAQCGSCKATIEKALLNVDGVKSATLDLDTKVVAVKYSGDKTNVEALKNAITAAGYDADEVPADPQAYEQLHSCCKKE